MGKLAIIIVMVLCVIADNATAKVTILEHTRTYRVSGNTIQAVVKSMKRNGPRSELHGRRALAMADYSYWPKVQLEQKKGLCRVSHATVSMRIYYVLPQLSRPQSLSRSHRSRWRRISSMITRHERQHGRLYRQFARQLQAALSKMPPRQSCAQLRSKQRQLTRRLEQANIHRNRRFDRAQYKPFNRRLKALAPR